MKERNLGVDLLRIGAAFSIIILHIINQGGMADALEGTPFFTGVTVLGLLNANYWGVNVFGLVSGYVGYSQTNFSIEKRVSKFVIMWLQVVFYCLIWTIIGAAFLEQTITFESIKAILMPITYNQYWYFTAYFGIYLFAPWINRFIQSLETKSFNRLALCLFLIFSLYGTFLGDAPYAIWGTKNGYSVLWLLILYILGAWVKKNRIDEKVSIATAFSLIVLSIGFMAFYKVFIGYHMERFISPLNVIVSIMLLIAFSKLKFKKSWLSKTINYVSLTTFGIYLFHVQHICFVFILSGKFSYVSSLSPIKICVIVYVSAILIFIAGIFAESIRLGLFKLLRIDKLSKRIGKIALLIYEKIGVKNYV